MNMERDSTSELYYKIPCCLYSLQTLNVSALHEFQLFWCVKGLVQMAPSFEIALVTCVMNKYRLLISRTDIGLKITIQ